MRVLLLVTWMLLIEFPSNTTLPQKIMKDVKTSITTASSALQVERPTITTVLTLINFSISQESSPPNTCIDDLCYVTQLM